MTSSGGVRQYSPEEIASATGGFHEAALIGEGGFGRVFRAMLSATPVAIKVMDAGGLQGEAEFSNELSLLSRLRHPHLVRLLGCCRGGAGSSALVYELMPGGSVDEHLAYKAGRPPLPWCCRIRCAAQAGSALAWLHAQDPPVIHRDVKPANIFLDGSLNAKIGDVGLAAAARHGALTGARKDGGGDGGIAGEWPYLAPEYRSDGTLSIKTDVYAWGICLLQLATGALDGLACLLRRCRDAAAAGRARELLDAGAGAWDAFAGWQLVSVALWCCCDGPEARPVMSVAAGELARLAAAVRAAGGAGGACQACCSAAPVPLAGWQQQPQQVTGGGGGGYGDQPRSPRHSPRRPASAASGNMSPRQLFGSGGIGGGGAGAGFWRA